ncbi:hypothetical protein EDB83DRAFT_2677371 [Lactarius deliciosus]|nr:hypothetical protein EDB83DRAFT_2677371 [Lactarius deliciosus]
MLYQGTYSLELRKHYNAATGSSRNWSYRNDAPRLLRTTDSSADHAVLCIDPVFDYDHPSQTRSLGRVSPNALLGVAIRKAPTRVPGSVLSTRYKIVRCVYDALIGIMMDIGRELCWLRSYTPAAHALFRVNLPGCRGSRTR